ncbi:MAG: CaiB/BaiF CoA-transferase family protein [Microthrixaceae bacterium]
MPDTPALDGIRVLDLASVGPGARASRTLADYGASVVKVGAVPRTGGVQIVPPYYAYSGNRGMQRALFDLKSDPGRAAFMALAKDADVIIESFRPGVVDRLGIGFEAVRGINPGVVYCSTSGFGQSGPRNAWAGHDINYLGVSGFLDCTGRREDGRPALPGATVADIAAGGMQAAMSVMAALLRRERTGEGEHLDVSIADGSFALMSLYVDEYLATGVEPGPGHYILTGRYACYDVYTCADGKYVAVGAIEPAFWRNLVGLLGLEQYSDNQLDDDLQDEIRAAMSVVFATRPRDEWVAELGPANTCVTEVNSVAEAINDDQYVARGTVADAVHVTEGPFRQAAPIWAGTAAPAGAYEIREGTITDTAELLVAAGLGAEKVDELISTGVIA